MLVVDANPARKRRVVRVLSVLPCDVAERSFFSDFEDGAYDAVVVGWDDLGEGERDAMLRHAKNARRTSYVALASTPDRSTLDGLMRSSAIAHFIARPGEVDAVSLLTALQKLFRGDVFGIEKYFEWCAEPKALRVRESSERADVVRSAELFLGTLGAPSRVVEGFAVAVDELVTNALYHAPAAPPSSTRRTHVSRASPVTLEPDEEIVVMLVSDGRRAGVSVSDPFGCLTQARALEHLAKYARREGQQVDEKPGGAGLGICYVFDAMSELVINIAPRKRTEIIGVVELDDTFRRTMERGKALHVFVEPS